MSAELECKLYGTKSHLQYIADFERYSGLRARYQVVFQRIVVEQRSYEDLRKKIPLNDRKYKT